MENFIKKLPKVELHLHIEGTLEPSMMLNLAKKNNIEIPYKNIQEVNEAYKFKNLQSFLDLYYLGAKVLKTKDDFFELTWAYMLKCKEQNIVHTEIFFDPQTHIKNGINLECVISGITLAMQKAKEELNISSFLIACILRDESLEDGLKTLDEIYKFKDKIISIGLDSAEVGNPPSKFAPLFKKAKDMGFKLVAHAGEEAGANYIKQALELGVNRIDHGVKIEEDEDLMTFAVQNAIPLTMCPLSNLALKVFNNLKEHNAIRLFKKGLCVTINSDDPAYFGGYLYENFIALQKEFNLSKDDIKALCINAISASFLDEKDRVELIITILQYD